MQSRLKALKDHLHSEIHGQDHLLDIVWRAIVRAELGLDRRTRLLLLGPTGVGKTELTLTFSRYLFGEEKVFRFDCSELNGPEAISLLLGNRQGDLGLLGTILTQHGEGTLLFDEIEKADRIVMDLLLQILDPGRFKLASGLLVDASRFYIVATGNIGSADLSEAYYASQRTLEQHVLSEAHDALRLEIFNRFDETLVFRPLSHETELSITTKKLAQYLDSLSIKGYQVTAQCDVVAHLAQHGFDRRFGARPILRAVRRLVGDAIAQDLLMGGDGCGEVSVNVDTDELILE